MKGQALWLAVAAACASPGSGTSAPPDRYREPGGEVRVGLIAMPYHGERDRAEVSEGPGYVLAGLDSEPAAAHGTIQAEQTVGLTTPEEAEYGVRRRLALADAHLAQFVGDNERAGVLSIAALATCTPALGMLAGLQHSGDEDAVRRVGMVYIDAHADFNTPETSLSGMLGGMPLAVSVGLALHNLRHDSGLDPALPVKEIVLAGARDLDSLEAELVQEQHVTRLSVEDLRNRSPRFHEVLDKLAGDVDLIYVHVDMDVLDTAEVSGHHLKTPGGPTSTELAAALREIFRLPQAAALGIASTPYGDEDPGGLSKRAAVRLMEGALEGVRARR